MNRLLAIGDIHGCYRSLDAILSMIQFSSTDTLVLLGDFVDRGPRTREVIDRVLSMLSGGNVFPLRGNHELMMLAARDGIETRRWMIAGGDATLDSYNRSDTHVAQMEDIPERHWDFLKNRLLPYYETENHIFVHGAVDPARPMAMQLERTLCWSGYTDDFPGHCWASSWCAVTSARTLACRSPTENRSASTRQRGTWVG